MAELQIVGRVLGSEELSRALAKMSSHDIPKAIKHGVRVAARGGRTTMAKEIGQRYSLTAGRIKKDVSTPQFQNGGQTAIIRTSRKPITAMQFKARQTKAGISMAIYKGQRSLVKSGFIAKGKPFYRTTKSRYPLKVVHGPSIHAIYTGGNFSPGIQGTTEARIEEQLVNGILQGIGKVGGGFIR